MTLDEAAAEYASIIHDAEKKHLAYPLVLVNNELKVSGSIDTYHLMFLVDEHRRQQGLPSRF